MPTSVHYGDFHVGGNFSADDMDIPASSVINASVNANAAIAATKVDQQPIADYKVGVPAAITQIIHVAHGAGNVAYVHYAMVTRPTASTFTFDVLKNGVSILSAPVSVTNAITNMTETVVTFVPTAYVLGDVFTTVLASFSGGTYGTGLYITMIGREAAGV